MDEGPLTLDTINRSEEGGEAFLELLKTLISEETEGGGAAPSTSVSTTSGKGKKATLDYAARLAKLSMVEDDCAKLTSRRATALVIHPSERTLVVVSGDVDGNLGVWQVSSSFVLVVAAVAVIVVEMYDGYYEGSLLMGSSSL